ncbi:uncharacterized protein PHACADRAFT_142788 [Phanerochaete carnosa HHB-10118-sp]|uniref:Cytochrome P450 n=1 Tax=Phanerochaete carnosa (strain HHB-10118-sp) TaxID=650164 RepID=K5UXZ0_PHACS|nr:uncharacterized protein PHACADRAFT_142788 [Phanerochaete carnosa HHB-10118-sp]EKM54971.1 hypothetical protein PHACADRAFT_142788 [Phanerochaete carnosa HHB-10118-sp]
MESVAAAACTALSVGCLTYIIYRTFVSSTGAQGLAKLPGPRGWPFIGYLRAIEKPECVTYKRWSDDYKSDILGVNMLGTTVVIANTLRVANELLEARSAIYSDRCLTMLRDLVGFGWNIALARYDSYWRDARKIASQAFHPQAIVRYRPAEVKATLKFLLNLMDAPEDFRSYIKYFAGQQILHITYGLEIQDRNDPYIAMADRAVFIGTACVAPGSYLVDLIPILKYIPEWFPGAGFKRQAREWRKDVSLAFNAAFAAMKVCWLLIPSDCMVKPLVEKMLDGPGDPVYAEYVLKGTLSSMYIAGADTTVSILDTFFLAMTLHPDVLQEAQRSVDRICEGRLPNFSDYDALPWVHAIVKECLRWRPVSPMVFAHMLTKDDIYEGYHIPKGSLVLANAWAVLHDLEAYSDPEAFNPRRFLRPRPSIGGTGTENVELDPTVRDPMVAAFGFGRRICPGRHMAYESLWIAVASVVAAFDITKAVDAHGAVIEPSGEYTDGFLTAPKPFRCCIRPRSAAHAALVQAAPEQDG